MMEERLDTSRRSVFMAGVHDGVPIALGYFVVAFTLGILAKTAGLTPWQGFVTSAVNIASAGEYAGFTVIAAQAPYLEIAVLTLVANARYFLMAAALTQRFAPETSLLHRLVVSFGVTDEIFGITVARGGLLNPYYNYGAMAISVPAHRQHGARKLCALACRNVRTRDGRALGRHAHDPPHAAGRRHRRSTLPRGRDAGGRP